MGVIYIYTYTYGYVCTPICVHWSDYMVHYGVMFIPPSSIGWDSCKKWSGTTDLRIPMAQKIALITSWHDLSDRMSPKEDEDIQDSNEDRSKLFFVDMRNELQHVSFDGSPSDFCESTHGVKSLKRSSMGKNEAPPYERNQNMAGTKPCLIVLVVVYGYHITSHN